jgi:hypothetical protein
MPSTPLQEIRNPDVIEWEWEDTYPEFEGVYYHQIVWIRGTSVLWYSTKAPTTGKWVNVEIREPERFGFRSTLASARKAALAFYEEGKSGVSQLETS